MFSTPSEGIRMISLFIAERQVEKLWIPIFIIVGLSWVEIEADPAVLIAW